LPNGIWGDVLISAPRPQAQHRHLVGDAR